MLNHNRQVATTLHHVRVLLDQSGIVIMQCDHCSIDLRPSSSAR